MQTCKHIVVLAMAVALVTSGKTDAQEFAHEIMTGRPVSSAPRSVPILAHGEDPQAPFPPKPATPLPQRSKSREAAFCVRSCDGRYFPAPPAANRRNIAEGCKSLCPASEMKVFHGSTIDEARSRDGKAYSALANAFRYRRELVKGCTCNGRNVRGLASIKPEDDWTLRRGDMLATENGMKVVRSVVGGEPRFASLPDPIISR